MATARTELDKYLSDNAIEFDDDNTSVLLTGTLSPAALLSLSNVCDVLDYRVWVVSGYTCLIQSALTDADLS